MSIAEKVNESGVDTARDRWLEERRKGIGGSDISALLGLNPYRTPYQLWLEKTGRGDGEASNAEAMYWGRVLEDAVARRYSELTGRRVQRVNQTLRLADTVALANIDRAVINPQIAKRVRVLEDGHSLTTDRILECKTAHALAQSRSEDWGEEGTDEVPESYWLQVQWYLGISGAEVGDLAVLFGGQKHLIYTIEADREIFSDLLAKAQEWWEAHVEADIPPDPSTAEECRRIWRSHTAGKTVAVDVSVAQAFATIARLKEEIKDREQQVKDAERIVFAAMQDAEAAEYNGEVIATWKQNRPSRVTDWRGLAQELSPPEELIEQFTSEKPGARVLRLKNKEIANVQ